jgi:serine/threonine-protein kinase
MKTISCILYATLVVSGVWCGCGREPSHLLRQGQLPIYDFPLYLTEGVTGQLIKIERDRTKTVLIQGLKDPRGIATDRFQNVYIAEYGAGRILKVEAGKTEYTVIKEGLQSPSVMAVDSFGDLFVAQDGTRNITRVSDDKVFASFDAVPTAFAFGVDDIPIIGLFSENIVYWGWNSSSVPKESFEGPINASIDGTGRVYVAQGDPTAGKLYRYDQRRPGAPTLVADNLMGPCGIAIDLVGNIFAVEQGAGRIILTTYDGKAYSWISDVEDPQYLAFTQY